MSGATKYSPTAQRDSLDESVQYTQAPPSYEDQPSTSQDQDALLGGPRSSEDNIPDDFKVRRSGTNLGIAVLMLDPVRRFCRRGYHRHSHAVCSEGLLHSVRYNLRLSEINPNRFQHCATPSHGCLKLCVVLQSEL